MKIKQSNIVCSYWTKSVQIWNCSTTLSIN